MTGFAAQDGVQQTKQTAVIGLGAVSLDPGTVRALARAVEARRTCRPPARPTKGFKSSRDRAEAWAASAADAIIAVLDPDVQERLLGSEGASQQLAPGDRAAVLRMAVVSRAGSDGAMLVDAYRTLHFVRGFAACRDEEISAAGGYGFQLWPLYGGLAAVMIQGEQQRTVAAGKGSRGGFSGGATFRSSLRNLACLGYLIELECLAVMSAAPKAKAGGGRKTVAATLPLKLILHEEWVCGATLDELVNEFAANGKFGTHRWASGVWVLRFYARSLKLSECCGIRLKEAERVAFFPDEHDPVRVVRGRCWMSKDGEPINVYAYAEGVLGPFAWLAEHLADIVRVGQTFPSRQGGFGSGVDPSRCSGVGTDVAGKPDIVKALFGVWRAPPLSLSDSERQLLALKGHSLHGTSADVMRLIGEHPEVPFELPPELARGFNRTDRRISGNWLRDKSESDEDALDGPARAAPVGAESRRDDVFDLYARGAGREGERAEQLRARGRFVFFLRAAYRHWASSTGKDWRALPMGREAWAIVAPSMTIGAAGSSAEAAEPAPPAGHIEPASDTDDDASLYELDV